MTTNIKKSNPRTYRPECRSTKNGAQQRELLVASMNLTKQKRCLELRVVCHKIITFDGEAIDRFALNEPIICQFDY